MYFLDGPALGHNQMAMRKQNGKKWHCNDSSSWNFSRRFSSSQGDFRKTGAQPSRRTRQATSARISSGLVHFSDDLEPGWAWARPRSTFSRMTVR
jgi:hypothetical protein